MRTLGQKTRLAIIVIALSNVQCFSANAIELNVNAGSLLKQAEEGIKVPQPPDTNKVQKAAPIPDTSSTDLKIQVSGFRFVGNTLLTSEQLSNVLSNFTNRMLSLAELKQAAEAVATAYREAGWTVRAFLPKQEVDNEIITIQIIEAVFGGATLQGYTQKDWNQTLITKVNQLSAQIHKSTLRGGANFIVVSSEISAIFDDLEYFHVSNAEPEQDQYVGPISQVS